MGCDSPLHNRGSLHAIFVTTNGDKTVLEGHRDEVREKIVPLLKFPVHEHFEALILEFVVEVGVRKYFPFVQS